tara:strand:- start:4645 stop:4887 length:243 start_codon:yes stop_codon:yes gene_type:complete
MQYTRKQIKAALLSMYKEDVKTMSTQDLANKYDVLRRKTGINVFSIVNKGKPQNRNDINVLGGNSGGGRTMSMYKSGHQV